VAATAGSVTAASSHDSGSEIESGATASGGGGDGDEEDEDEEVVSCCAIVSHDGMLCVYRGVVPPQE